MLLFSLKLLGWLLAHTPELLLRALAAGLGDFLFFCLPRRRRLVLSNLHHAFPAQPATWHRSIGRASCRRMIETGLLSLATPYLSADRLRAIVAVSPELLAAYALHRTDPAATLICSPHLAYWEAQTSQPLVVPGPFPEFGIIFRPLDNPAANAFIKTSRERFGMKLLSRKEGFAEALKILRRRGFVGVLFDQNAGLQGALTTLFGRVCSTTELPGLMAEKFHARVYGIYPRRRAFWRVEVGAHLIATGGTTESVPLALNRWLEQLLTADDNLCSSWLWAHDRWRNQDIPQKRFRLEAKRDLLAADLAARTLEGALLKPHLPRRTRIYVRLPNWLGDVVMAAPLIMALRVSRPDAEVILIAKKQFQVLLAFWGFGDGQLALPSRGFGYFLHFWRLKSRYPDVYILLTNSFRGDLEAWLTRAPQRFGLVRPGKPRPLLTHSYVLPEGFDESQTHQLDLWENFFRHFGLNTPPIRHIARTTRRTTSMPVGLICGSENNPEKRWPVPHWRTLIETFRTTEFILFGTPKDAEIATAVAAGFDPARVRNLAGKTHLLELWEKYDGCRLIVTNDTGGMHLANAVGVPLLVLFGPTNPVRTGPVFSSASTRILQPPGCPPTGGGNLADLSPETVSAALHELLAPPPS